MKHTKKKRILALVLCMVLVLSTAITALAVEGEFYYVPKDTVELSREIMKDGASQGTLYATVPGGTFRSSADNANLQMDMQEETASSTVIEAVQKELEATGNTEYTVDQAVMGDVSFWISTDDKAQIPEKAINFRFENTSLDTSKAMGFVYDRSNGTLTLYNLKEDTLQFEEDVQLEAETVVVGCFDVAEKTAEETQPENEDVQTVGASVQTTDYTIMADNPNGVTITVQHYLDGEETPLYKDSTIKLDNDQKTENLGTLTNYTVKKVVEVVNGKTGNEITGTIILKENKTYRVYYEKKSGSVTGDVQMFDYYVNKGNEETSINSSKNYPTEATDKNTRFASGATDKNQHASKYDTFRMINGQKYYINAWDEISDGTAANGKGDTGGVFGSRKGTNAFPATGIINGINYKTGALSMGMGGERNSKQLYEPGFFTNSNEPGKAGARIGKEILSGYQMVFSQDGDTYNMQKITQNGNDVTNGTVGSNFFPLDDITNRADSSNYEDGKGNDTKHNDFFGMRYDISFTLGDYLGNLNYSFTGDDDLWVVLDAAKDGSNAGKVILDLGGIHTALTGNVDLWEVLLGKKDYTTEEKIKYLEKDDNATKEHTLTVLYMERGANVSNCDMRFTLPNSKIIETTDIVKSDLELTKVNTSGVGIEGAKFELVNDGNASDKTILTSDKNGKITFAGLKESNTYTLNEISVPSPYVKSTTAWKVKVEGNPLKAVLYDSTGATAQTLDGDGTYHIVNDSQEDIVSRSVESNKTVSVKDYNNRIYQVDLTASSKATQTVTKTTPYDIVMVLDTSGSMSDPLYKYTEYTGTLTPEYFFGIEYSENKYFVKTDDKIYQSLNHSSNYGESYWYYTDANSNKVRVTQGGSTKIYTRTSDGTKMAALKTAAKAFVSNVEQKNPDSRISIVSFSGSASIKTDGDRYNKKYLLRVGNSKTTIDSWIDNLSANGATNTADGFDKAKGVFSSSEGWADVNQTAGRKKMVVFLTDGVPTTQSDYSDTVAGKAVTYASNIKRDYEADIYSLGIFDAAGSNGKLSDASIAKINKFMTDVASDASKYMTADSIESLYNIFNSITENMPNSVTATITDVIDSRFELTAKQKDTFAKRSDVQVTYNNNGTTTVTWTDTTVNSKTGDTPGWHETIEIKAKDDFIGGNMIPTNGSASGITVGENTKLFPQPSVNVKLLTPSIGDKEITYYKGDTIESSKFSGELLGTYKMTELDGNTAVTKGIPQLTTEQLAELKKGGTVEVPYSYTNSSSDIEGKFVYMYRNTKYEAEGTKVNSLENHTATKVGQDVEEYKLTVTFVPAIDNGIFP